MWSSLGGDPAALERLSLAPSPRRLPARLRVDDLAVGAVGAALLAASELRGGVEVALDPAHVAVAFASERHLRVAGEDLAPPFAALSRFAQTADGWIRTHANYPHHHAALLRAAGDPPAFDRWRAVELEEAIVAEGGCAAAVRTAAAWREHPQGRAVASLPLVEAGGEPLPPLPDRPPRVLDMTRVIAGPVATRFLAALGADVLRIDPPFLPELRLAALDGGPGKRSALLDVRAEPDRFDALLAGADVLVHGYRPGALPIALERHPHLRTVQLSAWGRAGPWRERRGFDSLVQAATGIALVEGEPGALPVQALDHATGYLVAAAVLRSLAGGPRHARLALARTAQLLLDGGADDRPAEPPDPAPFLVEHDGVTLVAPPGAVAGTPLAWPHGPHAHGADDAAW